MNITIIGMEYDKVKNIAKAISKILCCEHIDFKLEFEKIILQTIHNPLIATDDILQIKESELLKKINSLNNVVVSLNDDVFLSNSNYKIFENSFTVLIVSEFNNKIKENIQNLLKKYTKIHIKEDDLNINELINKIRG